MIRPESSDDHDAVRRINKEAFDSDAEARLVDELREQADPIVSLVEVKDDEVVGHILFSPVTMDARPELRLMGLAPMAVTAGKQRSGIGSRLVEAGLEECRRLSVDAVVVLGHPEYYPRFGFVPSTQFGFKSEYDVPDEVFMAMELNAGALEGATGPVQYHPVFASL